MVASTVKIMYFCSVKTIMAMSNSIKVNTHHAFLNSDLRLCVEVSEGTRLWKRSNVLQKENMM